MTKSELIEVVAARAGGRLTKKAAAELIDTVFETIQEAVLKEERFTWPGFGTWSIRERRARQGRNPITKEPMLVPASRTIGFRPAKELKSELS